MTDLFTMLDEWAEATRPELERHGFDHISTSGGVVYAGRGADLFLCTPGDVWLPTTADELRARGAQHVYEPA